MSETVQTYIDKHSLQKKVEDVLNNTVKAKPEEPLSFMVRARPSQAQLRLEGHLDPLERPFGPLLTAPPILIPGR